MQPPKPYIWREEAKTMQELKRDTTRMILTAEKGVSMVVMDKEEYIQKSDELLSKSIHKTITTDPSTK